MSHFESVELKWDQKVPMRDGVRLSANIYLPRGYSEPIPAILVITPYIADSYHNHGMYFAENGIPCAIVDTRGRGNSEGDFVPYRNESTDGYDCVEWLASQPFCAGSVGMWHGSYMAYIQWVTAAAAPPHLTTIVPTAAPFPGVDIPMRNNIFHTYNIQWLALVAGRSRQSRLAGDDHYWASQFADWCKSGKAYSELDSHVGLPSRTFQEWIKHPTSDPYWNALNPTDEQYARLNMPVLTITGIFDDEQPGALEHYKRHLQHASADARAKHFLLIGPWNHAGTGVPCNTFGGITVDQRGIIDFQKLHLNWFRWIMGCGARPELLAANVVYYMLGAEEWRYAEKLEDVTRETLCLHLDSRETATDVSAGGELHTNPGRGAPDAFQFDPRNLGDLVIEAERRAAPGSLIDQSLYIALNRKQLVYHSEALPEDLEVCGFFQLAVWLSIDCPDADFYVSLHEVQSDGTTLRLSTDAIRARYRLDKRSPALIQTDEPLLYEFKSFTFTSRVLKRGHRLRLVISPIGKLIDGVFAERNMHDGGEVALGTASIGRVLTVRLFHDNDHPSILKVPLGKRMSKRR